MTKEITPLDKYENGSTLPEECFLNTIIQLGVVERTPVFVFPSGTVAQFINKLIPLHVRIDKERIEKGRLSPEEWSCLDRKLHDLWNSLIWVNDLEITSIENYKSKEDEITNMKIKHVFFDSLPDTIDKSEIIKWSEAAGFNVYFTNLYMNSILDVNASR